MAAKKKKSSKKPSGINDSINDFLDRREVAKYGPRIDRTYNEAQYMRGDMSKAMRAKQAVDRMAGRTVEFGTRSMLEAVRGFMRGGGGLRSHGK